MALKIIYPGTFDPITNGHIDIVLRAASLFDEIIIAVATNYKKNTLFSLEERLGFVSEVFKNKKNILVTNFSGLLIDFARENNVKLIMRGLRAISDFEYELQLANLNRNMCAEVETIFLAPSEKYSYISSSMVREIASLYGNVSQFVPNCVSAALQDKFKK